MRETQQYVVMHYGEVSIKGKNRPIFLRRLVGNVQQALGDLGNVAVEMLSGRLLVAVPPDVPWATLEERLRSVFGVANFARCAEAPHDLEAIKQTVSHILHGRTFASFRITARRAFKELPFHSLELQHVLGAHVLATHQTRVALDDPVLTVYVDIVPRRALVYVEKIPGAGGLPVGISGVVLSLLSGGIDSPVAAWKMIKRGCRAAFVHFHSFPYTNKESQEKTKQLVSRLAEYQFESKLFLVPFAEVQRHIMVETPADTRVILYRRYMMRLAEQIARRERARVLLQVFPRKNDPNGDDITDFDVKGLKIMTRKGAVPGATVIKEWDKVPTAQAFTMLQLLADKKNIDDQLGLSSFGYSRGLGEKCNSALEGIRSINNGKEKADAQDDVYKRVTAAMAE